jgi:hypothetical protein
MVFAALWIAGGRPVLAQMLPADGDFIYHTRSGDTLIGVCRILLLQPQRWHEVQTRNGIPDPRRIPTGSALRVPYAWLKLTPESATVATVSGSVRSGGAAVVPGQALAQGATIETGADGSVTLDLADGSVLTLQKSAVLSLAEMQQVAGPDKAHDLRLKLQSGRLQTVVKPHRDVGRFEIETPVAISAVRGTVFRTGYSAAGSDGTTETLEGTVSVAGGSAGVLVHDGFGTRVNQGQAPSAPVALLPPPDLAAVPARSTGTSLRVPLRDLSGAKTYRVQLSTDADFNALVMDVLSDAPVVTVGGVPDGNYWLRARGIDPSDIEGRDAVMQLVRHLLPEPPVPVTAAGRSVAGPVPFEWSGGSAGARYRLQVARDPAFADLVLERQDVAATGDTEALAPGRYYWRVAGIDAGGERGDWSVAADLAVLRAAPQPQPPVLDHRQVHLSWESHPGERYRVQLAHDPAFERILAEQSVAQAAVSMKRPHPGIYYARVQIVNDDGTAGSFGPARRFEVPVPLWIRIVLPIVVISPLLW